MAEIFKNKKHIITALYIIFVIYLFYNLICLIMANVLQIRWLWLSLLYINVILESYFSITGFMVFYNPIMYQLSLPIIPMILIRPIIVSITFVNVLRDIGDIDHVMMSNNYYVGNISFCIILISLTPILTIIIPSIISSNRTKRTRSTLDQFDGSMGNPVFQHVGTQSEQYSVQLTAEEVDVMMKAKKIIERVQTEDDINNTKENRLNTINESPPSNPPHPHPIQAHQTYSDPQIRDLVHNVSQSNVWDNEEMRQTLTGKSNEDIMSRPTMKRPQTETGAASIPFERDPASNFTKKASETDTVSTRSHLNITIRIPSNTPNTSTTTNTSTTRSTQKQSSSTHLSYNNSHNTATDTNDVLDGVDIVQNAEIQPLTLREAEPEQEQETEEEQDSKYEETQL